MCNYRVNENAPFVFGLRLVFLIDGRTFCVLSLKTSGLYVLLLISHFKLISRGAGRSSDGGSHMLTV